jgi:hypothetical protein
MNHRSAALLLPVLSSLALGCLGAGADPDEIVDVDGPEIAPAYASPGSCTIGPVRLYDVAGGVAAAVRPSVTDADILDADPGGSGDGYGWHAVAWNPAVAPTRTIVWLQGSKGKAYSTSTCKLPSQNILEEAIAKGYLVLQLGYANSDSVGSICQNDPDCYGPVRGEIVTGQDLSALVDVNAANGIENRLSQLVGYLKANPASFPGMTLPAALAGASIDYANVRFGGHSQGGGHAGIIAKNRLVQQACFLSSIVDNTSTLLGQTRSATWLGSGSWATPTSSQRTLYHAQDDAAPGIEANNATVGVTQVREKTWCPALGCATYDAHGAIVNDARYAADRAWACFD